jgi:hypothetical protein
MQSSSVNEEFHRRPEISVFKDAEFWYIKGIVAGKDQDM